MFTVVKLFGKKLIVGGAGKLLKTEVHNPLTQDTLSWIADTTKELYHIIH